jgi:hypothetical protein
MTKTESNAPVVLEFIKILKYSTETSWQLSEIQKTGPSLQTPSSSNNDMTKLVAVVQQIMTELTEAVPQKDKIMDITKIVLILMSSYFAKSNNT